MHPEILRVEIVPDSVECLLRRRIKSSPIPREIKIDPAAFLLQGLIFWIGSLRLAADNFLHRL
jgi:hypothetical protein